MTIISESLRTECLDKVDSLNIGRMFTTVFSKRLYSQTQFDLFRVILPPKTKISLGEPVGTILPFSKPAKSFQSKISQIFSSILYRSIFVLIICFHQSS